jgi:hypothetical protein
MNHNKALLLVLLFSSFSLAACSGPKGAIVPPGGGGNANVTVTFFDAPPANTSFINFNLPISSISLTPQSGADVTLTPTTAPFYEVTRLQSDSSIIGTFQVPTGTYTALNIFVNGSPFSAWRNSSNAVINGCNPSAVCILTGGAPGKLSVDLTKALGGQGLTVSGGQNVGLGLEINLNNAITTTGGISIDLTQPNVFTALTLPRTGQAANTIDTIESFLGVVKTVSGSKITLQAFSTATLTATAGSGTTFNAPPGGSTACGGNFNLACIAVGQTLSVDATVALDGTLTLSNVDFLDLPAVDEIEGTIFLTSTPGTYSLVVSDETLASGNAILQSVRSATILHLTLDPAASFLIETSNLPVSSPVGFLSASDIINGQTVLARVKSVTQGTLTNIVSDRLILRFSRLTGTVGTVNGNDFSIQNLPSYLPFITAPQARTFVPQTIFDGVTNISGLNGVTTPVSIRGLLLNPVTAQPPLLVAKVRKH